MRALTIALAALSGSCNFDAEAQMGASPHIVSPQKVPKVIRAIPNYTRFSYSGLTFFNKKLYASSNIGLLEFDGGSLSNLYKWHDRDDVVSGPWLDVANNSVWVMHDGLGKLIRYDGEAWAMTELPEPKEGYSRGDMLSGFRGTGTSRGFWLEGGGHAWRWIAKNAAWEPVPMPQDSTLVRVLPLKDKMLLIMRHELLPFLVRDEHFKSDTIHNDEGRFNEVPNKTGKNFFAEQVAIIGDLAYVLTREGVIFRVTPNEITRLEAPEDCETIVATTAGFLLASFRHDGIYEYAAGWRKKFPSPYPPNEAEHWTYLSESNGQIALAITSKPYLDVEHQPKDPGQTTLWISSGSELKPIPIGDR